MWTQFIFRLSDVHIWDTINTDEQLTHPCVCNYTSGYKSMRKVLQCIPLKTMAALAVLEDIVNGGIRRKPVLRDRVFAGTWWQLAHQPFWGQSSWNCAQSCGPALQRNTARSHALLVPQVMCTLGFKQPGHSRGSWPTDWDCVSRPWAKPCQPSVTELSASQQVYQIPTMQTNM